MLQKVMYNNTNILPRLTYNNYINFTKKLDDSYMQFN